MTFEAPRTVTVDLDRLDLLTPFELSDHLERGHLLLFPVPPVELPSGHALEVLQACLPANRDRGEIGFNPRGGRLFGGADAPGETGAQPRTILAEYHHRVVQRMGQLVPSFTPEWRPEMTFLRMPGQRDSDPSISAYGNRIALETGGARGDPVLCFLANLDERESRWHLKGTVFDLVETFGEAAGLPRDASLLEERPVDRMVSGCLRALARWMPGLAITEQSAYDRALWQLSRFMRESDGFQQDPEGRVELRFPPRSCWLVYTDLVGQACLSGGLTLVSRFAVPWRNFRHPELSSRSVLDRYAAGEAAWPPGVPAGV